MNILKPTPVRAAYIGQRFGNYRLEKLLGQGGFAIIYLGKHQYLGTQAAVKVLNTRLVSEEIRKFSIEARIAARLVHPHVVRVLDFGLQNNIPFLVMDYAPNGTLRQLHFEGQVLPLNMVLHYVRQITDGLQYIHNCELIHQDLKPENLLIGRNHQILLSDFGIAITEHRANTHSKKEVIGTVPYMAPEQIQGKPCFASDQYALAVLIYEWLCGEPPFQGSPLEVARKHLLFSPPSMREKVQIIPPAIENVVMQALSKQPEQRFSSVQVFATALEQAYNYTLTPVALNYRPTCIPQRVSKQPTSSQLSHVKKQQIHSPVKKIATLFATGLLIGTGISIILYASGLGIQFTWFLLAFCFVPLPLLGTLATKKRPAFLLASSILIISALSGFGSHSLTLFLVVYIGLFLLSTLVAFSLSLHRL